MKIGGTVNLLLFLCKHRCAPVRSDEPGQERIFATSGRKSGYAESQGLCSSLSRCFGQGHTMIGIRW